MFGLPASGVTEERYVVKQTPEPDLGTKAFRLLKPTPSLPYYHSHLDPESTGLFSDCLFLTKREKITMEK